MSIQRATKAELQMLREYFWLMAPRHICTFCLQYVVRRPSGMTFGHRRHPPVDTEISIHHEDRDRENNKESNLSVVHRKCHERYHAAERAKTAGKRRADVNRPSAAVTAAR